LQALDAKNLGVIMPDADMAATVTECVAGSLSYNGEYVCVCVCVYLQCVCLLYEYIYIYICIYIYNIYIYINT